MSKLTTTERLLSSICVHPSSRDQLKSTHRVQTSTIAVHHPEADVICRTATFARVWWFTVYTLYNTPETHHLSMTVNSIRVSNWLIYASLRMQGWQKSEETDPRSRSSPTWLHSTRQTVNDINLGHHKPELQSWNWHGHNLANAQHW